MSHYGAAKAAVINFTTSLAAQWAGDDIWVNCIAPGLVTTEGVRSQMGVEEEDDRIDRAPIGNEESSDSGFRSVSFV